MTKLESQGEKNIDGYILRSVTWGYKAMLWNTEPKSASIKEGMEICVHARTKTHAHTCARTCKYIHSKWHQGREQIHFAIHFQSCHFAIDQNKEKCMGEGSATMVLLLLFEVIHGELDFNLTAELVPLGGHMQGRTLSSHLSSCENL